MDSSDKVDTEDSAELMDGLTFPDEFDIDMEQDKGSRESETTSGTTATNSESQSPEGVNTETAETGSDKLQSNRKRNGPNESKSPSGKPKTDSKKTKATKGPNVKKPRLDESTDSAAPSPSGSGNPKESREPAVASRPPEILRISAPVQKKKDSLLLKNNDYKSPPVNAVVQVEEDLDEDLKCVDSQLADEVKMFTTEDDYLLCTTMSHTNDILVAFLECNFSKRFSLDDLEERWRRFQEDPIRRDLISKRLRRLDCERRMQLEKQIPFNNCEINVVKHVKRGTDELSVRYFSKLLDKHRGVVFRHGRTPEALYKLWFDIQSRVELLDSAQFPAGAPMLWNDGNVDTNLLKKFGQMVDQQLTTSDFLKPTPTEDDNPQGSSKPLATLESPIALYELFDKYAVIGRGTEVFAPDIDVGLDDYNTTTACEQAFLEYDDELTTFVLKNLDVVPIFISSHGKCKLLRREEEYLLPATCTIDVGSVRLHFGLLGAPDIVTSMGQLTGANSVARKIDKRLREYENGETEVS